MLVIEIHVNNWDRRVYVGPKSKPFSSYTHREFNNMDQMETTVHIYGIAYVLHNAGSNFIDVLKGTNGSSMNA